MTGNLVGYPDVTVPGAAQRMPMLVADLAEHVYQALGAASSCWENLAGAGVFESDRCAAVGKELLEYLLSKCSVGEPSLGCATTEELAAELHARVRLGHADPGYRSTDG